MDILKKTSIIFVIILMTLSIVSVSGCYILNESLMEIKYEKQQLTNDFNKLQSKEKQTKQSLNENISELKKLQSGNRYEMHDPTYQEVINFIHTDKTDEIPYDDETFTCASYAQVVNNNAEKQGIRCAYVVLAFNQSAHTLIGFNTTDKEMIYIEPQSDEWVENLEINKEYWTDCVIPESGYYYIDDSDDTIESVLIFW